MTYYNKKETIRIYEKLKKNDNLLFQEDISIAGNKKFIITKPEKIFDKMKDNELSHYYEFWTENMPIKFSYDIDINLRENPSYKNDIECDKLLLKLIDETKKKFLEYYEHNIEISNIIILENNKELQFIDNPYKKSFHIIFDKIKFENHLVAKDFYYRLNKDCKISQYCVDNRIYNLTCLRILFNSKKGKSAFLEPKVLKINNKYTCDITKTGGYNYFLKSLITYTKDCNIIIKKDKIVNNIEKLKTKNTPNSNIKNINLKHILDNLPMEYCDEYDTWSKIGMILSNISTEKNDFFELWNTWSSKSIKYKEHEMNNKWLSFKTDKKNRLTVGTLIKWAQKENIDDIYIKKINSIEDKVEMYKEKDIILDNFDKTNLTIIDEKKLTHDMYKDKIDYRLLAVQSEKGTGKTSNLLKALFELSLNNKIDDNTSILFISSRITFGFKLLGDLGNYGFKLYSQISEHNINSNRIICQLDSLLRLSRTSYDIIIVDECESLARYMTSSHFINNNKASLIIENLQLLVQEAKQVFIMDADLSDRCLNYFSKVMDIDLEEKNSKNYHVIQNTYKSFSDYIVNYMNFDTWIRKVLIALENNEKIVIASASNSKAKDILELIKLTFPTKRAILIHKETSIEEKRQLLLNVNREWVNYDIVIYTPSVCMGVSFDVVNYFDNIYVYGCKDSLGSQELAQMVHRVRSPKSLDIFLTLDIFEDIEDNDNILNYETVENMLCNDYYLTNYDLHNNIISKRVKKNDEVNEIDNVNIINSKVIYYPYKNEPIYDLYVRNSIEIIENKLNFSSTLFGYIKSKKYKLNYIKPFDEKNDINETLDDIKEDRKEKEKIEKVEGIKNAPELTQEDFNTKCKIKDELLTKVDIYSIQKYNLRNCYNILYDFINIENNYQLTDNFIIDYHDRTKMRWFRNISTILNNEDQTTYIKLEILRTTEQYNNRYSNCYIDFSTKNKYTYHKYPLDILKILEFDINDLSIHRPYDEINGLLEQCMIYLDKCKDDILFKYNIRYKHKNLSNLDNDKIKLKYINKILTSQYGLNIIENDDYYKLTCNDEKSNNIWLNLPNIVDDEIYNNNNFELKYKIKPLKLKNYNNITTPNEFNKYNACNLDLFIDEMDDDEDN